MLDVQPATLTIRTASSPRVVVSLSLMVASALWVSPCRCCGGYHLAVVNEL